MCHSFRMNARTYPIKKKSKKSSMSPRLVVRMIRHWLAVSFFCLSRRSSIAAAPGLGRTGRGGQGVEGQQDGGTNLRVSMRVERSPAEALAARPHSRCCPAGIPPVHIWETGGPLPYSTALTEDNDLCQLSMIKSGVGL